MNKHNICAIIITAFNAQDCILTTLKSLKQQNLPDGWSTKFYIGVDNCRNTAMALEKRNIEHYFTSKNVGTYVLTNSLVNIAIKDGCSIFLRFDSDDFANDDFLHKGITNVIDYQFSRTECCRCDEFLQPISNRYKKCYGSVFFSKEVFKKLGGYHSYRVSSDKYFVLRAGALGYNIKGKSLPRFLYRTNNNSLTSSKKTGLGSEFRENVEIAMQKDLDSNKLTVVPETVKLSFTQGHN